MRYEIAQEPTAAVAARLPALEAQACRLVFEVPGHDHVMQLPDRTAIQECLRAPPRRQLREFEVHNGGPPALARRVEDHLCAREIGGKRLLQEHRLPELQRALRDGRLEVGRHRDRDYQHGGIVDQCLPVAEPTPDIRCARESCSPFRVTSRQRHDLATGVVAECRHEHGSPVIAPDDPYADHERASAETVRNVFARVGTPLTTTPSPTSRDTTAPAPTIELSPTLMRGRMTASDAIWVRDPIRTLPRILAPGPMVVKSPIVAS